MAAQSEKILGTLDELVKVAQEHEQGQPPYYSRFALQHLDHWKSALGAKLDLPEIRIDELRDRVAVSRRMLEHAPDDVRRAILDALGTSVRLYRGLPGGVQTPPPMPPPKP